MTSELINPSFLFNLSANFLRTTAKWDKNGVELDEKFMIPNFHAELGEGPNYADLRMAWNDDGLLISLRTAGKNRDPECDESKARGSDSLMLLIDTRNTKTIHRANRFCHQFQFSPFGSVNSSDQPFAQMLSIHRAKELPKPVEKDRIKIRSDRTNDGYQLQAFVPGDAITGWDPSEHARIGFSYFILDKELGQQTFSLGLEFPVSSDPSVWGTLELRT